MIRIALLVDQVSENTGISVERVHEAVRRAGRPIVLNQSSLKEYQDCQRLYAWRRLQNLEPPGKRSVLEIGTATHLGLAAFHSGETLDAALEAAEAKLDERAGPSLAFEDKSAEEAKEVLRRILPAYVEHWRDKGELWKPLNQEIEFLVEVGRGTNVWLRGKSDNLSIAKGGLYLIDYKTAGRLDPRDLLKYELDMQLTAYIYGLSKHLTEESLKEGGEPIFIRGAIIDVLVKTQTPQFARELYTRTPDELHEFELEFIELASRIREQEERVTAGEDWKIVFPKSTNHCFRWGTCAYRDLCLKDTPIRRRLYNRREPDYVDISSEELQASWKTSETSSIETSLRKDENHE